MSYACLSVVTKLSGGSRICKREVGGARSSAAGASIEAQCPSPENLFDFRSKNVDFQWILCAIFAVQLPIVQARNTAFGLTKHAAAACMQCTAQRQQKAANTSLLESRILLQTATLVFPRPIVCSLLSNNINILAKKFQGRQRGGGGHATRPRAGSATDQTYLFSECGRLQLKPKRNITRQQRCRSWGLVGQNIQANGPTQKLLTTTSGFMTKASIRLMFIYLTFLPFKIMSKLLLPNVFFMTEIEQVLANAKRPSGCSVLCLRP